MRDRTRPYVMLLALLLLPGGCSFPKIIILNDPLSAEEHIKLGSIYEVQNKPDQAREQYRAATRQDKKNVRAWMLYGDLSYRAGDLKEAGKAYDKALDLDPKNGDVRNNLAWVYVKENKRLGEALDLVNEAMTLQPDHRPYYLDTLGVILLKQGKTAEALAALTESAAIVPKEQAELLAEVYEHLAEARTAAGDAAGAEEAAKRSKELRNRP